GVSPLSCVTDPGDGYQSIPVQLHKGLRCARWCRAPFPDRCGTIGAEGAIMCKTLSPIALALLAPGCNRDGRSPDAGAPDLTLSAFPTFDCAQPDPCTDGVLDSDESDVDCGGATCAACADGKACRDDGDCTSQHCHDATCVPAGCNDGALDGK